MPIAPRDARCFVCGSDNAASLGIVFRFDNEGRSIASYVARPEHDGWPGILHGAVLYALFDDAVGWAARYRGTPSVTARAEVRYRKPVPTHTALVITGSVASRGRVLTAKGEAVREDTGALVAEFQATLLLRPDSRAQTDA